MNIRMKVLIFASIIYGSSGVQPAAPGQGAGKVGSDCSGLMLLEMPCRNETGICVYARDNPNTLECRGHCKIIPSVANAYFVLEAGQDVNQILDGDKITYTCNEGYMAPSGSVMTIICGGDGTFPAIPFQCKKECNFYELWTVFPNSGIKSGNGNLEDDIMVMQCRPPYTAIGDLSVQCNADGQWIGGGGGCYELSPSCIATAEQSSTLNSWDAEMAIDDRFRTSISGQSCSCTTKQLDPWWMADYKMQLVIRGIKIWNRSDCCWARLANLVIYVSPLPTGVDDSANQCATFVGPAQEGTNPITVNCAQPMTGRYVKIQMQASNYLTLCEVELIF